MAWVDRDRNLVVGKAALPIKERDFYSHREEYEMRDLVVHDELVLDTCNNRFLHLAAASTSFTASLKGSLLFCRDVTKKASMT